MAVEEIQWQGRTLQVERICDRGWAGLAYRTVDGSGCYLLVMRWLGGAYDAEVRPISEPELKEFCAQSEATGAHAHTTGN